MGLFSAFVETVTLPVAIVKDVVTVGGTLTDQGDLYTSQQIDKIEEELDKD